MTQHGEKNKQSKPLILPKLENILLLDEITEFEYFRYENNNVLKNIRTFDYHYNNEDIKMEWLEFENADIYKINTTDNDKQKEKKKTKSKEYEKKFQFFFKMKSV